MAVLPWHSLALVVLIGTLFYYGWPWARLPTTHRLPDAGTSMAYPSLPEAPPEDPSPFGRPGPGPDGGSVEDLPWPSDVAAIAVAPAPGPEALLPELGETTSPEQPASPPIFSAPAAAPPGVVPDSSPDDPGRVTLLERRAVVDITPRVGVLAALAEEVGVRMREYVAACHPARVAALPGGDAHRDWPVPLLLDPEVVPARLASTPSVDPTGCGALWDGVRRPADRLVARLEELHDVARSKGLLPGHVREALAEYTLEDWDRYARR